MGIMSPELPEVEIEQAVLFVDRAAHEEGRVRRHPAPLKLLGRVQTGLPVADDFKRGLGAGGLGLVARRGLVIASPQAAVPSPRFHVQKIPITRLDRWIFENFGDFGEDVGGGVDVVGVEDADHLAGGQAQPLVHGVVDAVVGLGDEPGDW